MPPLAATEAVAFDLDGTLVDSAPDIRRALNLALARIGLGPCGLADVRRWVGDGPDVLIERALASLGQGALDAAARAALRRDFDAATLDAPFATGSVYDGIADLLAGLAGRRPVAVVTNKPTPLAEVVLEAAGLRAHVACVLGGDAPALRKPAPALLLAAAARFGLAPERLAMVGDGAHDLLAARAAGCPAVLVAWGYGAAAASARGDALLVAHPAEIPPALGLAAGHGAPPPGSSSA